MPTLRAEIHRLRAGTPGGVGHARTPARYLRPGSRLVTEVDGIGRLDNRVRWES
jgi:acylpyruvate hydrolase